LHARNNQLLSDVDCHARISYRADAARRRQLSSGSLGGGKNSLSHAFGKHQKKQEMRFMLRLIFPKQIGRLSYFVRIVPFSILNLFFEPLAETITPGLSLRNMELALLALASIAYGFIYIILPRVRDADLPRTSMICVLIPILNIAYGILLLLKKTEVHPLTYNDVMRSKT
jgi:hypothetical protein